MKTTLMIMAAGMGSRYGGNKQIDHMGPKGQMLMEYSLFDALEAGFDKVVFVIKKNMKETFDQLIGNGLAGKIEVAYAFQEYDSLPEGFTIPEGREKPYGTVHAVLCAKEVINEPFAVINADDYYGKTAFSHMAQNLKELQKTGEASMVGYKLKNTISPNGHVTRGVCKVDQNHKLEAVVETYKIAIKEDGSIWDLETATQQNPEALVSMNFWGFTPWIFEIGNEYLSKFLATLSKDEMKKEYPLPEMIDGMMKNQALTVTVLSTDAVWFGVTYKEDKPVVMQELNTLHEKGDYPMDWKGFCNHND